MQDIKIVLLNQYCETCEATDTNVCKTCPYHQRGSSAKCYDAIDVGVATMHKYQKIQEIVKNTQQLCSYGSAFIDIREVIQDGNNNVPEKVAKAIITLLHECEKNDSTIVSAISGVDNGNDD